MKNFKKLFASLAIIALLTASVPTAVLGAATYSDEQIGAYDYAYSIGVTTMSTIENANMNGSLIRSHMAKMMVEYAKEVKGLTPDTARTCEFTDIANQSEELRGFIVESCQMGLMGQGIVAFNPNGVVTRAEFGTVLSRVLFPEVQNGNPYYETHLAALKAAGIMNNIDNPNQKEVRGRVMLMMQRAAGASDDVVVALPGFANITRVGSVVNQDAAKNAVDKKVGTIKLTAGENDTTVSAIVIERSGLGQIEDIDDVQLYHNGEYVAELSTKRDNKFTVRFSPVLVMKANSSIEFDVLVNLKANTAGSTHNFAVTDITIPNGSKSGLPVTLGTLTVANYDIATGSVSTFTVGTMETGKRGDLATVAIKTNANAKVDGFTITAPEGAELTKMIGGLTAYINNVEVGTVTVKDESIIVKGLNINKTKTQTSTIKIKADGIHVGKERTGNLYIKTGHIVMFEENTNERMNSAANLGGLLTVKGVDLKLENLTTKTQHVALGATDVELLNVEITSSVNFDINDYTVSFDKDFTAELEDVYVYINGVDYPLTSQTGYYVGTKYRFDVANNAPVSVKVIANVKDDFIGSGEFKVTFEVNEIYNANEKTYVPVTNTDITSHKTVIDKGDVNLSKRTVPATSTVKEGTWADVMFFNLEAKAEDQILTGITFTYSGAALTGVIKEIKLVAGTTTIETIKGTDIETLTTSIAFTDLSYNLQKDKVTQLTLKVLLEDGEVASLGSKFEFTLDGANVLTARNEDDSVTTTVNDLTIKGTTYTVATDTPTVAFTVDGTKVSVVVSNPSSYAIELTGINFSVLKSIVNSQIADWTGIANLLDVADVKVTTQTPAIPSNNVTFSGLNSYDIASNSSITYILDVEGAGVQLTPEYYTTTIKWIEFIYTDGSNAPSNLIKETY